MGNNKKNKKNKKEKKKIEYRTRKDRSEEIKIFWEELKDGFKKKTKKIFCKCKRD